MQHLSQQLEQSTGGRLVLAAKKKGGLRVSDGRLHEEGLDAKKIGGGTAGGKRELLSKRTTREEGYELIAQGLSLALKRQTQAVH